MNKLKKTLKSLALFGAMACCTMQVQAQTYKLADYPDIVMYQVNPRVFAPFNSLSAVAARLDSIKALGVNTLWIMPIYPIGELKSKNSPYSIRDYDAVAPEFGTLQDYRHLVAEAHKRGMAVIQDWVANHTAWDHAWVKAHPDWYTHNENGEIISPQGPGWDWTDVADLNYDNKDMRKAMVDAMRFWVEYIGIDGYRCDVADAVPADFWRDCIKDLRETAKPRRIVFLAEGKNPENFTVGDFDLDYGWDYKEAAKKVFAEGASAATLFQADADEYAKLPAGKIKMRFTTNHDQSTEATPPVEFTSLSGSMAAYVATVFLHGGALVYSSQEVGYDKPINFFHYVPVDWSQNSDVYQEYQHLLKVYNENEALRRGSIKAYPMKDALVFERATDNNHVYVVVNVRNKLQTVSVPKAWRGVRVTDTASGKTYPLGAKLRMAPFQYYIFK